MIVQNTKNL